MSRPNSNSKSGGARTSAPESIEATRAALGPLLGSLLDDLIAAHREWIEAVREHRESVRRADTGAMQGWLLAQQECAARVAGLEEVRRGIVDRASRLPEFSGAAGRARSGPLTLGEIAASTPDGARRELIERADHLRTLIGELRRANSTLHAASAALLAHTEGLMRQVARRLSAAGTYGRRGFVEPAPSLACALDLVH